MKVPTRLKWKRDNRHPKAKISHTVNGKVSSDFYYSSFVLSTGYKESVITFTDEQHADGFEKLLEFVRFFAAAGQLDAMEILELLGEENVQ